MGESTRTDAYWDTLRSKGKSEEEIAWTRERLANSPLVSNDSTSSFFVHEARNALGGLLSLNEAGVGITAEDIAKERERLLAVRDKLDWHTNQGPISKGDIIKFLDKASKTEWNLRAVRGLKKQFQKLEKKLG